MTLPLWNTPFVDFSGAGSKIPAAWPNQVRLALPNAIDGAGGGSYAPTAPIVVTGANGLQVFTLLIGSTATVQSGATLTVTSGGFITLANGSVGTIANGANLNVSSGGKIQVLGGGLLDIEASATLRAEGAITLASGGVLTCQVGGVVDIEGSLGFGASSFFSIVAGCTVSNAGNTTQTGPIVLSGTAACISPRHVLGADANTTYDGSSFDAIRIPQLTTADRTYTLSTPANSPCDFELFWYVFGTDPLSTGISLGPTQGASSKDLIIQSSTGSVSIRLAHNATPISAEPTAQFWHGKFHYDGTNWKVMSLQHP